MRSVVQGLDLRASWERYLRVEGEASDQRTVRATIAWIRDEFSAAAKREDRYGTARLLRIDATRIAHPSLDPAQSRSLRRGARLGGTRRPRRAAFEAQDWAACLTACSSAAKNEFSDGNWALTERIL